MRVISGTHGGRRLVAPATPDTRPVTDKAKESIFSSLGPVVEGARVADLYAGAGSFGIEALSRGAADVVFVETGRRALTALRTNLDQLGMTATVVATPVEDWVRSPHHRLDVVFCDPPWSLPGADLGRLLEELRDSMAPGGIVVITRRSIDDVPEPQGYSIDDERRHGDTRIVRYTTEREPA